MVSRCLRCLLLAAAVLAVPGRLHAETIPLAVNHGHCEFVVATPHSDDRFYLVVGSLADASRVMAVRVSAHTADGPELLRLQSDAPDEAWMTWNKGQARELDALSRKRRSVDRFTPPTTAPALKTFHLFTGARDLDDPANYHAVQAVLRAVGRNVQVYLDGDDRNLPNIEATIAAVVQVFDQEIYPWAQTNLGRTVDVDRDGRFTILLSSRLGALQHGQARIDGFVRGSDFCLDLPAPFSNHCDMLYLNATLKPGPHLKTVLAHEFTHAVIFCEHALNGPTGNRSRQDEESWLNEGLAHLVESMHHYGWSNLDYRISAFLACPERYSLVVPDYFGAGIWREPGTRGAAFLFARSCLRQTDAALPRRLVQSPLHGISNLEAAARKPFPQLFRQASVDLLDRRNYDFLPADPSGRFAHAPRTHEVSLTKGQGECQVAGTAAAYFLLHSPAGGYARVVVEAGEAAQVTLVRQTR